MDHTAPSVARYIRLAREGQGDALPRLLEAYRNYVRLLAATCLDAALRGKVGASDIVQETLFKANERFHQFRGTTENELIVWLRRILAHHLADVRRRYLLNAGREVGRERSIDEIVDRSSASIAQLLAASGSSPSEQAQRRERSVLVADALAALPEDDRDVITLRNFQELEWTEVARRMNRSPDAVRMLWTRALRRLGDRLGGETP